MGPSGTRDKGKKSRTVPEIPGQLEPMIVVLLGLTVACHILTLLVKSQSINLNLLLITWSDHRVLVYLATVAQWLHLQ